VQKIKTAIPRSVAVFEPKYKETRHKNEPKRGSSCRKKKKTYGSGGSIINFMIACRSREQ
jgi:hypothetical protein